MHHSPLAGKRIIVVGGGIAGLSFVVSLASIWRLEGEKGGLVQFPKITLYEREEQMDGTSPQENVCRTGYSLSIRSGASSSGIQTALKMGILDSLLDVGVTRETCEGGLFGLWSHSWTPLVRKRKHTKPGLPVHAVRVQRTDLRKILLESASKHSNIVWGVTCDKVVPATRLNDSIKLELSNGHVDECDLVVVADGANSRLHSSLVPGNPCDSSKHANGIVLIAGVSRFEHGLPDPFARDWGILPAGNGIALFVAPMDCRCANWTLSYRSTVSRYEQRQSMSQVEAKALLQEALQLATDFESDMVQVLLNRTDLSTLSVRNAYDRAPFAHGPDNHIPDGLIFIGDSNHAVTPFAGNGANMALRDGLDLAKCLLTHNDVPSAVEAYDTLSMPRAYRAVRRSRFVVAIVHAKGIAWTLLRMILFVVAIAMQLWYRSIDAVRLLSSPFRLHQKN
jgi:2-polyprenyl-6-methoxyphenol hydroxylase-like FAD-dependent oxidoreductase